MQSTCMFLLVIFLFNLFMYIKQNEIIMLSTGSDNHMKEFPVVLCGLPQLDVLDISGNKITEVPDGIEDLQAVEVNLNMNQVCC